LAAENSKQLGRTLWDRRLTASSVLSSLQHPIIRFLEPTSTSLRMFLAKRLSRF